MNNLVFWIALFSTGVVWVMVPHLTPRVFLFGVRVPDGFRESPPARAAVRLYQGCVLLGILASAALLAFAGARQQAAVAAATVAPMVVAIAGFYQAHIRLRPYAAPTPSSAERTASLGDGPGRLPRWFALAFPPLLAPVGAAAYLYANWERIPARFPIHFGMDGTPNGWSTRTPLHVFGICIFGEGLMLLLLAIGLASFFGARQSRIRDLTMGVMVGVTYLLGLIMSGTALLPLIQLPPWALLAVIPVFLAFLAAALYKATSSGALTSASSSADADDSHWSFAGIYNNPDDPALFVEKRLGIGFTLNFGNPWARRFMVGVLGGVALLSGFLIWSLK
jgi:uncharacterized membrane protein